MHRYAIGQGIENADTRPRAVTALAGFLDFGGGAEPTRRCEAILAAQAIYGRRHASVRTAGDGAIGRRLFDLLPEDRYGPDVVACAGGLLVADIRIDDRAELCAALGIGSSDAARLSDSSILAAALERWEDHAVDHLVGDYAFAWWQPARERLVLARDFQGKRPLHYHRGSGFFAFASMPKGLHALHEIERLPDPAAVADFLALIPEAGTGSFFKDVGKVPPGTLVTITRGSEKTHTYWHPDATPLLLKDSEDYAEAIRERFDAAVSARLRGAGGRLASHLSGGLDSSTVTATAARLLNDENGRLTAYTSVPPEDFDSQHGWIDEGPHATAVAAMYKNIDHFLIRSNAVSPLASLDRNTYLYERPYLNLCNGVWTDAINDHAKSVGLQVLLTGAFGNASFSFDGLSRLPDLMLSGNMLTLCREIIALYRRDTRLGTIAAATIGPLLPNALWRMISRMRGSLAGLGDHAAIAISHKRTTLDERAKAAGTDLSQQPPRNVQAAQMRLIGRIDFGNYYKGTLAGWGLDIRDPSADRRLVELCLSIPAEQFLSGGVRRALARRAFADRLPSLVVNERRKGYQGADWYEGLIAARKSLVAEIDHIERDRSAQSVLDMTELQSLARNLPEDGWNSSAVMRKYRLTLLRRVSAGHFLRKVNNTN